MSTWNSAGDTATRLFVPFGIGADREKSPWWDLGGQMTSGGQAEKDEQARKANLYQQSASAGGFADQGQAGYAQLGGEAAAQRAYLQRVAGGQDSVSAEQLRQGMLQGVAAQRSMAAGAAPQDAAGAARTAAIQSSRLTSGLAGQQAVAGLQERQNAQQALANMILQQRQQDLQASLQSRSNAITGYGANNAGTPEKTEGQKVGPVVQSVFSAMSDRRLKKNIKSGDEAATRATKALKSYIFEYKNPKHGKGSRPGVMAQDLEKAGLGHAVIETSEGKAIHGGHLAASNTAMLAALERRVAKVEGARK